MSFVLKLQSGVIALCEDMKNKIGVIAPYMQPRGYCALWDMKNKIGVIVPYMQPGVIVPCEDMKKNDRDYCALYAIQGLLCPVKT